MDKLDKEGELMQKRCRLPMTRRRFLQSVGAGALVAGGATMATRSSALAQIGIQPGARLSQSGGTPSPQWDSVYRSALGTQAMGYAYAAAQNGKPVAGAGVNLSRSTNETQNPNQQWTLDTLFNIASLSKGITAVGFMGLVAQQGTQLLDMPFWSILTTSGRFSGTPATGVDSITVRQLLTHYSGLADDVGLYTNGKTVDQYVSDSLQKPLANPPGSTYLYSNTNFDVLGVLYEILAGAAPNAYVQLIKANVLTPMGIDTTHEITDSPDPANEAVSYSGPADTRAGRVWPQVSLMAAGGWLGTVNGVMKFLIGLRSNAVLDAPTTQMMLTQQLGWFADTSPSGQYFHKNGLLTTSAQPAQEVHTGVVIFPGGYDSVLFVNSALPSPNPIGLMAKAFGAPGPLRD